MLYYKYISKGGGTLSVASYFGSSREDIVRKCILDIESGDGFGYFDLSNMLTRPTEEAHGIVWKVVVNGYDAQDEFEVLPPLGVGRHKFDVYFNRPMDVSVTPSISMGVRPPYTQVTIAEEGSWSADSTIYTAYLNILYAGLEMPVRHFYWNLYGSQFGIRKVIVSSTP